MRHDLHIKVLSLWEDDPTNNKETEPRLNIKTVFPRYADSHVKDKTVIRPSYL